MLKSERQKDICRKYSTRDKDGYVHCNDCPLVIDRKYKEKVIKELKKCADNSYDMWCAIDSEQDFGEAMAYKNAIKIVEKGGIE